MTKKLLSLLLTLSLGLFCLVGCSSGGDDNLSEYDIYLNFMSSEYKYKGKNIKRIINNESTISFLGYADTIYEDSTEISVFTDDDYIEDSIEYNPDEADYRVVYYELSGENKYTHI